MNQERKIIFNRIFKNLRVLNEVIKQSKYQINLIEKKYIHDSRGRKSAQAGQEYELKVWNVVNKLLFNDIIFNTQKETEIAGFSNKNDIECNFDNETKIGIELKKSSTPDWMQCGIKYDFDSKSWYIPDKGKIPTKCKQIFRDLLKNMILFEGGVPPFINNKITHSQWVKIKSSTKQWNDMYIDIPSHTIRDLYRNKGCYYIQLSNYGLYHLGSDICNFEVPEFIVDQQIRIRTKIHSRNKGGSCILSVMAACQPKDLSKLSKSNYSLDCESKIPKNLKKY
jgi:hypothetical protein